MGTILNLFSSIPVESSSRSDLGSNLAGQSAPRILNFDETSLEIMGRPSQTKLASKICMSAASKGPIESDLSQEAFILIGPSSERNAQDGRVPAESSDCGNSRSVND